jgi:single-strand DNA-binding protein
MNIVVLRGRLSRPVDVRQLPSGGFLASLDVTIEPADVAKSAAKSAASSPGAPAPRRESVPVAWFSAPTWAEELTTGEEVIVTGRVRRRFFRTPAGTQSRTEVVADRVLRPSDRRAVARSLRRAADVLTDAAEADAHPAA